MINRLVFILYLTSTLCQQSYSSDAIRGVEPSELSYYKTGRYFKCIDQSLNVPFTHVNDDYCDCPDGSDEPGTSACSNFHFYCPNPGVKPKIITSSRVNDRVCDCCDGSDEWQTGVCNNTCLPHPLSTATAPLRPEQQQQQHQQLQHNNNPISEQADYPEELFMDKINLVTGSYTTSTIILLGVCTCTVLIIYTLRRRTEFRTANAVRNRNLPRFRTLPKSRSSSSSISSGTLFFSKPSNE